jgi:CheY-like chemotaxis protein
MEVAKVHPYILVVDDDRSARTMLSVVLERAGHDVMCASNGAQALDRMRRGPLPEIVLLDLMMPRVNGWQVLEAMAEDPRLADIPVVVLTSFTDRDDLPANRPVLHKPVDDEALVETVDDMLAEKRAVDGPPVGVDMTPASYRRGWTH